MRRKIVLAAITGTAIITGAGALHGFRGKEPSAETVAEERAEPQSWHEASAMSGGNGMAVQEIGTKGRSVWGGGPSEDEEPKADLAFANFDKGTVRKLAQKAERTGLPDDISELSSIIPQTARMDAQNEAYRSLERMAGDGNGDALVAVAQVVPFIIDESTRSDAIYLLSWASYEADEATRSRVVSVLSFHLKNGPLAHWSLSADRERLAEIVESRAAGR